MEMNKKQFAERPSEGCLESCSQQVQNRMGRTYLLRGVELMKQKPFTRSERAVASESRARPLYLAYIWDGKKNLQPFLIIYNKKCRLVLSCQSKYKHKPTAPLLCSRAGLVQPWFIFAWTRDCAVRSMSPVLYRIDTFEFVSYKKMEITSHISAH